MKTNLFRWVLGIWALLALLVLVANHDPITSSDPSPAAPLATSPPATPPSMDTVAADPDLDALAPEVKQVVKLAESGLGEEIILAYIAKQPAIFNLRIDDIIYLRKIGISEAIAGAMIRHEGTRLSQPPSAVPAASSPERPSPVMEPPAVAASVPSASPPLPDAPNAMFYPPANQAPEPVPQEVVLDTPYEESPASGFESDLADDGTWIEMPDYGRCWQPDVAHQNPRWRPYCDGGRWAYTDCGWYWQSDYRWGWAPFHYGRWQQDTAHGWIWVPDRVWGPAWVSWRTSTNYCGWAPLPPGARFTPGVGFTFNRQPVRTDFEFGLDRRHYIFVPIRYFCDPALGTRLVNPQQTAALFRNTRVFNNYLAQSNTVINQSLHLNINQLARLLNNPVQRATVRDLPVNNTAALQQARLDRGTDRPVIYRRLVAPAPPSGVPQPGGARTPVGGEAASNNHLRTPAPVAPDPVRNPGFGTGNARPGSVQEAPPVSPRMPPSEVRRPALGNQASPAPVPAGGRTLAARTAPEAEATPAPAPASQRRTLSEVINSMMEKIPDGNRRDGPTPTPDQAVETTRRQTDAQTAADRAQAEASARRQAEQLAAADRARAEEESTRQAQQEAADRARLEEQNRREREKQDVAEQVRAEELIRLQMAQKAAEERTHAEDQARRQAEQQAVTERARVEEKNQREQERQAAVERARAEDQARRQAEQQAAAERARVAEQNQREHERQAAAERARAEEQARQQAAQKAAEDRARSEEQARERERQATAERNRTEEQRKQAEQKETDREKHR
jgi:hypothetical protein